MSKNKIKRLANHCWNKKDEEIKTAIEKAVKKEMIKKEEVEEVKRRIEENKKRDSRLKEEAAKREAERKKAREAEKLLWLQQEKEKKTEEKPEKVEKKNIPKRKKLQSAAAIEKPKAPNRKTEVKSEKEKRVGRILSLRKATQRDPIRRVIKNKGRNPATIWEFLLFPEDIGIEIDTSSAVFTEKKDCFVANLCGVLIKDIPKELRHENILKGIFSLITVKKVEEEWEEFYLNLIYRRELNGSRPVYIARIDSEKENPIEGSIHTTPTTNAKMILHLYPM